MLRAIKASLLKTNGWVVSSFTKAVCLVGAVFLWSASMEAQAEECQLKRAASLEFPTGGGPLVEMGTLEGKPVRLLVDTGTDYNVISKNGAHQRDLTIRQLGEFTPPMFLGSESREESRSNTVELANVSFGRVSLFLFDDYSIEHSDFDVILGGQFLSNFDLDLDILHNKIGLFSPDHCEGKVVYWAKQYLEEPIKIDHFGRIYFEVELDGKKVTAVLDTGAAASILDKDAAMKLFGIVTPDEREGISVASTVVPVTPHVFKKLAIDGLALRDPSLFIGTPPATNKLYMMGGRFFGGDDVGADLVLGLHELQFLHLYVSIREKKIYFTPATNRQ